MIVNDNLDASGVRTITTITDTTVTVDVDGQIVETRTPTADELLAIPPLPDDLLLTAVDPRDTTTIRRT